MPPIVRRFFHDKVCLRIEEYLPLQTCGGGHFNLQCVLPAHLRMADKSES